MAEVEISRVDLTLVDRAFADVERRGKLGGPAFRELRAPLRKDQRTHAKGQQGPDGTWEPRSPLTMARRLAHARSARADRKRLHPRKFKTRQVPARILGRLPSAIIVTAGELFVKATSRVAWSGVQQDGGVVGKGAKIPARVFLWASEQLMELVETTMLKHVTKDWGK